MRLTVDPKARARYPKRNFERLAERVLAACIAQAQHDYGLDLRAWEAFVRFDEYGARVNFWREVTRATFEYSCIDYDRRSGALKQFVPHIH